MKTRTSAGIFLLTAGVALLPGLASAASCSWDRNLKVGSTGADVTSLQVLLNQSSDTAIASSGPGSPGMETSLFGGLTKKAVIAFQQKYAAEILTPNGLTNGTGIVGASTRSKLMSLCTAATASTSGTVTGPVMTVVAPPATAPVTAASTLTVSDPGQAPMSLAPAASGVLFLSFNLTAGSTDVTVTGVTVQRIGFGSDGAFANLALYDDQGLQIGEVVSLNAQHLVTFKHPFKIPAGETHRFDVYANMQADETDHDGEIPSLQLVSIDASVPVSGSLPLKGSFQTVNNTLVVGGADGYLSGFDPNGDRTQYVNDKNVVFAGIRMTAHSQEDLTLPYIIWTESGSAGQDDLENVVAVVNGQTYPTVISPYSEKEYISFFGDDGIQIPKGTTVDVYLKGDLKPSAGGRTVEFDIRDNWDDVAFIGNTYQLGVGLLPAGNTADSGSSVFLTSDGTPDGDTMTPFFKGSLITVSSGAFNSVSRN